jgi:hypothetical protein
MSTTHEFDAHLDSLADSIVIDDRYNDDIVCMEAQLQDEAEMKEAYDAALRNQGAKDALNELKNYLVFCALDDTCKTEFMGLKWSIDSIDRRLSDLTEGGAA